MQELEKILEELAKHIFIAEVYNDDFNGTTITNLIYLGDVRDVLEDHMNDGWISVDERLPEDNTEVLITYADIDDEKYTDIAITTYGDVTLGGYDLGYKDWRSPFMYFSSNFKVLAWRPLPAPYIPKKTENNNQQADWREQFMKRFERVE